VCIHFFFPSIEKTSLVSGCYDPCVYILRDEKGDIFPPEKRDKFDYIFPRFFLVLSRAKRPKE